MNLVELLENYVSEFPFGQLMSMTMMEIPIGQQNIEKNCFHIKYNLLMY